MTKKDLNQNAKYDQKFINTFEDQFNFGNKPINRFKISHNNKALELFNKPNRLSELKKVIISIKNCKLKVSSNNIILGDGNINSPIIFIGEAPGVEEERSGKVFQGEVGALLKKMLAEINIKDNSEILSLNTLDIINKKINNFLIEQNNFSYKKLQLLQSV